MLQPTLDTLHAATNAVGSGLGLDPAVTADLSSSLLEGAHPHMGSEAAMVSEQGELTRVCTAVYWGFLCVFVAWIEQSVKAAAGVVVILYRTCATHTSNTLACSPAVLMCKL